MEQLAFSQRHALYKLWDDGIINDSTPIEVVQRIADKMGEYITMSDFESLKEELTK